MSLGIVGSDLLHAIAPVAETPTQTCAAAAQNLPAATATARMAAIEARAATEGQRVQARPQAAAEVQRQE